MRGEPFVDIQGSTPQGGPDAPTGTPGVLVEVLPSTYESITWLTKSTYSFAKKHKVLTSLYIFGLLTALFANGFTPSQSQLDVYNHHLAQIDTHKEIEAYETVLYWEREYGLSKGWFWTCDDKCQKSKAQLESAKADLAHIHKIHLSEMSEGKASVGVMSKLGVDETRRAFWKRMGHGKDEGVRMSWFDMFFMGIDAVAFRGSGNSDNSFISEAVFFIISVIFRIIMNVTVGLFTHVVIFLFSVISVIKSYQPSLVVGLSYYFIIFVTSLSVFVSIVLCLWGGVACVGFVTLKGVTKIAAVVDDRPQAPRRIKRE
eukprot:GHVN01105682.1.p1 GENE.GHVN01105682.1~~GHVN01105682.1.p1  ORF type:complete len:315 (+),score=52.17 GHVN01105682.1:85-1029(+)